MKSLLLRSRYTVHRDSEGNGTLISALSGEEDITSATLEVASVVMSTTLPPVMTSEQCVVPYYVYTT